MLRQRSISAIGVVVAAAVPAFIGGWVFVLAMLLLALLAVRELLTAFAVGGHVPIRGFALIGVVALVLLGALRAPAWVVATVVTALILGMLAAGIGRADLSGALDDWALTVVGTLYVGLPLALAVALRGFDGRSTQAWVNAVADAFRSGSSAAGLAWVGVAIAITWLTDTAAYLVGRSFGRTKLIPALSPGKTRVGAVGGVIAGALAGLAAGWVFGAPLSPVLALGVGFVLSIVGQIGDLGESLIKRSLGIKDMGTLIPGHGGILDRIDALLFTLPAMYALVHIFQEIGWL